MYKYMCVYDDCGAEFLICIYTCVHTMTVELTFWTRCQLSNLALSAMNHPLISAGVDSITAGMSHHLGHNGVQTQGCACLRNLAIARENQTHIVAGTHSKNSARYQMYYVK